MLSLWWTMIPFTIAHKWIKMAMSSRNCLHTVRCLTPLRSISIASRLISSKNSIYLHEIVDRRAADCDAGAAQARYLERMWREHLIKMELWHSERCKNFSIFTLIINKVKFQTVHFWNCIFHTWNLKTLSVHIWKCCQICYWFVTFKFTLSLLNSLAKFYCNMSHADSLCSYLTENFYVCLC